MPITLRFDDGHGGFREIEGVVGSSAMLAAVAAGIPGIDAECGGACSCGTCHVHVAEPWFAKVGPPSDHERSLLDFLDNLSDRSRLACQIKLRDDFDGLTLRVP